MKIGMAQAHSCIDDALKSLDKILIKGGYFVPVIFGEKDGKCFFYLVFYMMNIEKLTSPPIIGETYSVPCMYGQVALLTRGQIP